MTSEDKIAKALQLYDIVEQFINDNKIWDGECVYQSDRVIENSYDFVHQLCSIVGYIDWEDDD